MLHAQPLPASTRWPQAMLVTMQTSVFALGIAAFLIAQSVPALAQPRPQESPGAGSASEGTMPAFDFADWPLLDLIDARTNISVFFRSGVPAGLRIAGFRRAWTADPAIRDFKGLGENDWDFENLSSIPGFGELGPEVDVPSMVARILGESASVTLVRIQPDERTGSFSLADLARRLIFGTVHN